jgi:hypothetical protein
LVEEYKGIKSDNREIFVVLYTIAIIRIPNSKPQSPIRFTNKAFKAALLAAIRVYQKLTNKYEHNPTPSHPINNKSKSSADTKIIIERLNNPI